MTGLQILLFVLFLFLLLALLKLQTGKGMVLWISCCCNLEPGWSELALCFVAEKDKTFFFYAF